jgi:hypothetical protein
VLSVTGDALIAKDPAQAGFVTQTEAPKPTNKSANAFSAAIDPAVGDAQENTATSGTAPGELSTGLATAHPKPAKRLNARERQMAKKSGGWNDKDTTADGTKPMTAEAKSKVDDRTSDNANNKAAKAKEKAKVKAAQKAQKADTKARKISAAKAAKAARAA